MRTVRLIGVAVALALIAQVATLRGDGGKEVKSGRVAALIQELIEELGDGKFVKREAASKELLALGPAALDALRKAATSNDDLEVKTRAAAVIKVITEAQQKERSKLLDKSFVNGTEWHVAPFERGWPVAPDPIAWTFHRDGTVQAGTLWKGTWHPDGENAVRVSINKGADEFRVVFLSPRKFVALKGDELYRVGSTR